MKRWRKFFEERAIAVAQTSPPVETPGSLQLAPPRPVAPIIKDRTAEGGGSTKSIPMMIRWRKSFRRRGAALYYK